MKRIDIYFLLLATVLLLCGVGLGMKMGASGDFTLAPVHAHINLAGWASLALFGLAYRVYPDMAQTRLALVHFIVSGCGAVLLPIGIGLSILRSQTGLVFLAAPLWALGVLIFLVQLVGTLRRGDAPR